MNFTKIAKRILTTERKPAQGPIDIVNYLLSEYENDAVLGPDLKTWDGEETIINDIISIYFYSPIKLTEENYDEFEKILGKIGSLGDTLDDFNSHNYIQIDVNTGHTSEEIINLINKYESEDSSFNEMVNILQLAGYLQTLSI